MNFARNLPRQFVCWLPEQDSDAEELGRSMLRCAAHTHTHTHTHTFGAAM